MHLDSIDYGCIIKNFNAVIMQKNPLQEIGRLT